MKQTDLEIPEPCSASWEEMRGDHQKRFCGDCNKNVHNLSMLTEDDAQTLLDQEQYNLCVQYACNTDGDIMFKDTPDPEWRLFAQQKGVKLLLSAATLAVPLLMAGCDNATNQIEPTVTSPIQIDDEKHIKIVPEVSKTQTNHQPGASRTPPKAASKHQIRHVKGDIAAPEKIQVALGQVSEHEQKKTIKTKVTKTEDKPACDGEEPKPTTHTTPTKPRKFKKLGGKPMRVYKGGL